MTHRARDLLVRLMLFAFLFGTSELRAEEHMPSIRVLPGGWGSSPHRDTEKVCRSAATEFFGNFRGRKWEPILVKWRDDVPILHRDLVEGHRLICVSAKDRQWDRLAFQFSHECCHIASKHRREDHSNMWFEESLCEAASLFTLRAMAKSWKRNPPYPNWSSYAPSLSSYAQRRIDGAEDLGDRTLADWYREHEATLRQNSMDRAKNQVVAVALLPMLEQDPRRWDAVGYLNTGEIRERSFEEYLREWHGAVSIENRKFVDEVAVLFDVAVE